MSETYWLLGLPFDTTTLSEARARIFAAVRDRRQLVFATPNVSFAAQAGRDRQFRADILRTDLSLADGMPLVWLGRLLGVPFRERVAGSDLLESLLAEPGPAPLRVYFFGGEPGAAQAAMQAVNGRAGGLQAVGACFPGHGSVQEMSSEATIAAINDSNADLLVVALGAAKGHRWIEANRQRLRVPVISHLGAAINFIAGRLQRAPRLMQKTGLEWLWRIKEEPQLLGRYARDGWWLAGQVARLAFHGRPGPQGGAAKVSLDSADAGSLGVSVAESFTGRDVAAIGEPVRRFFGDGGRQIRMDMRGVRTLDARGAGWLYAQRHRHGAAPRFVLRCDARSRRELARWQCADFAEADA
jgi:N-acetylglucosaminyldiphosphoundecaprenol N-acetyl-beta-D-mannosaminyltransferase